MSMIIYAKIGTHQLTRVRVKSKRKPPRVGEWIYVTNAPPHFDQRIRDWTLVKVEEIKNLGYPMYCLSLL
jgi:hypothetical protein